MPEFASASTANGPFHDETLNTTPGTTDAFVAVLTPDLSAIRYWTYLGGSGRDRAYAAIEDTNFPGIWVVGFTSYSARRASSGDLFPGNYGITNGGNSNQSCYGASTEPWDVFVVRLTVDLKQIQSSTIIGGTHHENPRGNIAVDDMGSVYISGGTTSVDFPVTSGTIHASTGTCATICSSALCLDPSVCTATYATEYNRGPRYEGFLCKLDITGNLVWSRPVGGDGSDNAWGNVRVWQGSTGAADVFVGGCTTSSTASLGLPSGLPSFGARQGAADGYVAKFDSSTGAYRAFAYIGGSGLDWVAFNDCLELDGQGRPVVVGITRSADLPLAGLPLSSAHSNAGSLDDCCPHSNDIFVSKFSNDLATLVYSSYLNGGIGSASWREEPAGLALRGGNIYVSGETNSPSFPITANAFDSTINPAIGSCPQGEIHDAFIVKMFPGITGNSILHYSSYFGGDNAVAGASEPGTRGRSLSVYPPGGPWSGRVLLGGQTTTSDFGLPAAGHLTTTGVVFQSWSPGDKRSGFVAIHDTD